MKGCTKVKPNKWSCDVKLVRHVEGRKEEKGEEIKGKAIPPFGAEEKSEEKSQNVSTGALLKDTSWGRKLWVKRKRVF